MKKITESRFLEACDLYEGFCTTCQDFTRLMTEPDAEEYDCPDCGKNTVMGAEQALMTEEIGIK